MLKHLSQKCSWQRSWWLVSCLVWAPANLRAAEPVVFPWGTPPASSTCPGVPGVPHLTLPRGEQALPVLPITTLAPKQPYAYGWFGSEPSRYAPSSWGRHFGYSGNFTQWTSR